MRNGMVRLAGFLARRRWWVVGVWLLVVVAAIPLASRQTEDLTGGGFDVPGSESGRAESALESKFATHGGAAMGAVLRPQGEATIAQARAATERLVADVAEINGATIDPRVLATAGEQLQAGRVAVVPIQSNVPSDQLVDSSSELREAVDPGTTVDGVTTFLTGQHAAWAGLQELSKEDLEKAEVIGFPIVLLILLAVFGSLAAASLPLALGFVSVIVTGAVIYLLSQQMEMSVFVTNMASMIGIGVAIDYSLFILARFRESVRAGASAAEARAEALSTSGLAVGFSGLAVIISLAGLWMVDNQTLRSMALGAMVVVAVSILTAIILLPALIRIFGRRIEAGGAVWSVILGFRRLVSNRRRRPGSTNPNSPGFWERWTARVMRRPVLSVVATSSVLLVMAIPVLSLDTGTGALDQFPADHDVRVGAGLASERTGGGADPVTLIAEFDDGELAMPANSEATDELIAEIEALPGTAYVDERRAGDGAALISVTQRAETDDQTAVDYVNGLRDDVVPGSPLAQRAQVSVGGETARITDIRQQITSAMPLIFAFILGFSFLVLMVMLRSLLLPLKALAMNLLSIGAAYGILVVVFQWGWLDGFLGFESLGHIDLLTPPLVLAVVFGLSMDYEVFLLSRIRERYEDHGDNRRAVAEGLSTSARTISSAALIMTAVFAVFVLTGVPSIKELGMGNAVAIALDATLVRLILVPATMQLMGKWNWWLPSWLDRILPNLDFEGNSAAKPDPGPEGGTQAGDSGDGVRQRERELAVAVARGAAE